MNGAQLLVKCLESEGVTQVWGYPGGAIMPLYDALIESPIRHYLVRHEQGAGFAAQGFARSSRQVGVCLATSGPGATNLLTAIADAYLDSVPVVAITGQVPYTLIGTDAFQEVDVFGITLSMVKHSFLLDSVESIPEVVSQAFDIAASGRPGPVLIDFPKDISVAKLTTNLAVPKRERVEPVLAKARDIDRGRELLRQSQKPLLYSGGGVCSSDAVAELRKFVDVHQIPLVHTLHGIGGLPGDHEWYLGMLGMHGTQSANRAVQECDLLLAIGVRFDDRATGKLAEFAPRAAVVHLDIDPAELGKLRTPSVSLCGDVKANLERLTIGRPAIDPWRRRCQRWKSQFQCRYDSPSELVFAPEFLRRLSKKAPEETFVCCDVGQHQMWVAQHFVFHHPRQHLTSGGLGTMGFGLPAAIGVQCAHPEATVFAVTGDGSIMMNVQELATVRRYQLPVRVVLFDNSALGMVRQWQELFFDNRESEVDLADNPDFAEVARAFGIPAITITRQAEIDQAIEQLLYQSGPLFVHIPIDRKANVWPLVPPGANNRQMMDEPKAAYRC